MKHLNRNQKVFLTVVEAGAVFLCMFLNQMITPIFPAYPSVKSELANSSLIYVLGSVNCTMENPSNVYVAILIGSKYCTELIMMPIMGWFADKYYPPLILFYGALVETLSCILYSISGNFYSTMVARIVDAIGYSIISTSGLTLIYTIYLKERSRNKIITIESILVYIALAVSPYIAGSIFEAASSINADASRIITFMTICPFFLLLAVAIAPFAFRDSHVAKLLLVFGEYKHPVEENAKTIGSRNRKTTQSDLPPENQEDQSLHSDDVSQKNVDAHCDVETKANLSIVTLLKDPQILIVLFSLFFSSLIGNSLETTLPIFMIRKFCSDQQQQGVVWMFGSLSVLGFFLSSVLFHKCPRICLAIPIIAMMSTGLLCVGLYFCDPWWAIGICLGFMYFFCSMTEVLLILLIPQIIDSKYSKTYGGGSGLTLVTFTLSGIFGSFPMGPLVERFGFLTMCILLCVLAFVMAPFVYLLKNYFKKGNLQ